MSRIIVRNSCIVIDDYDLGDCPELERNFMVYDPVTHSSDRFGMYYDSGDRKLYLPRGIDLWKIKQYFKTTVAHKEPPNTYMRTDKILLKTKPRDDNQREALRFMIGVEEYAGNMDEPQLSVNLNTGKGKTYCSIATIGYFKVKAIIITASLTLLTQWKNNIMEYTNLTDNDIMKIDGPQSLNMIYNDKSSKAKRACIFLCSHATLRRYGEDYSWKKLNTVFEKLGIGIKIFDEAHTNFDNMLMVDFFTNVEKTYYVTATPARSSWSENKIYQLSVKNIPAIDLFDAVNDPHTEYIAIKYNSRPTAQQISMCRNSYGLDRNKYIDYLTKQPNFYAIMRIIMEMVLKVDKPVLMYIGTNESILRVYRWICFNYPEYIGDVGIYTSLIPSNLKFAERRKRIILSTTKSMGAGEDVKGLKITFVVAEPFRSNVLAAQTLGRTRDDDTLYIELVDLGFKQTRNFYYSKQAVFNKYAKSVSETTIDQYELDNRAYNIEYKRNKGPYVSPIVLHDERFFEYKDEEPTCGEAIIFYNK